ncbi:alpha/beta hydrolase family protein [Aurantivibrio plasticivorans]
MTKLTLPFGSWPSPISVQQVTQASPQITEPRWDKSSAKGALYWLESRPAEGGRNTIMTERNGRPEVVVPSPINVRSTVNEYGGGHYCVHNGVVYFVVHDDQQIYQIDTINQPETPKQITFDTHCRFGDLHFDSKRNRLIAVQEQEAIAEPHHEPLAAIVSISLTTEDFGSVSVLIKGADFYSNPTVSPDGSQIAWISWNHPNMPWDDTQAWMAPINNAGAPESPRLVAGQQSESVCQPKWSPSGKLFLISDRTNWWNLYQVSGETLSPVTNLDAEFAYPPWVYGLSNYDFLNDDTIIASYTQNGLWHLTKVAIGSGKVTPIQTTSTDISDLCTHNGRAIFCGGNSKKGKQLHFYSETDGCHTPFPSAGAFCENYSEPEPIRFSVNNHREAYGFYYSPYSQDYDGPTSERPPLLVFCHGGPTSAASSALNLKIQFWTSRGFAVADVNYSGSTGYGREYRHQLNGGWGKTDVEDIIACANYLVAQGKADKERLAIRGSSAGGYSVLAALTFHDCFKAGASLYGISNLETLAQDTHKFESRYMDSLVGPYPQMKTLYQQRSPINYVSQLNCPVIFLQGLKDKVVPPQQAETMVNALAEQEIPHAYITFEEEAHGFRQANNIHAALLAELSFYRQVFAIPGAEEGDTPVTVKFLTSTQRNQ